MKFVYRFFLFILITACAPIYVNYDYEKQADFSNYKTYDFYADMKTGLTDLDQKRFLRVLKTELSLKGLTQSDTPDFFIDIKSNEFQDDNRSTVGVGVGGSGRTIGGGISIGLPIGRKAIKRSISIEFVEQDTIKTGLFWKASSESNYSEKASPEARESRLQAIAKKMLAQYPPSLKK